MDQNLKFKFKLDDPVTSRLFYDTGQIIGLKIEYIEVDNRYKKKIHWSYKVLYRNNDDGYYPPNGLRTSWFQEEDLKLAVIDYVKQQKDKI